MAKKPQTWGSVNFLMRHFITMLFVGKPRKNGVWQTLSNIYIYYKGRNGTKHGLCRLSRQLHTFKTVAVSQSFSQSVSQSVRQSFSQLFRQSWECHEKSWESHEKVMRKLGESNEKVRRKSWESHEKVMRKL